MNYIEAFSNLQVNLRRVETLMDGLPNNAKSASHVENILDAMVTEFKHHVASCAAFGNFRLHIEAAAEMEGATIGDADTIDTPEKEIEEVAKS